MQSHIDMVLIKFNDATLCDLSTRVIIRLYLLVLAATGLLVTFMQV